MKTEFGKRCEPCDENLIDVATRLASGCCQLGRSKAVSQLVSWQFCKATVDEFAWKGPRFVMFLRGLHFFNRKWEATNVSEQFGALFKSIRAKTAGGTLERRISQAKSEKKQNVCLERSGFNPSRSRLHFLRREMFYHAFCRSGK